MSEPMPGFVVGRWEDGDLCPPSLSEIIRNKIKKKKNPGDPDPRPEWSERYDDLYLSLAVHQLASLMADQKTASGIKELANMSIQHQVKQLG